MGKVFLVGAGPGGPDLLTLRALRCIRLADILVVDDLVDDGIVQHKRSACTVLQVPKRGGKKATSTPQEFINEALVRLCLEGKCVVRLKGGDPLIFGRVWPEILALRSAGCAFELVPGITSALAAPCAAAVPLTEKEMSTSVTIVSGHAGLSANGEADALAALLAPGQTGTLVILMGTRKLRVICDALMRAGAPEGRAVAIVHACYLPEQHLLTGTLGTIADAADALGRSLSPAIIVIGDVAQFAR